MASLGDLMSSSARIGAHVNGSGSLLCGMSPSLAKAPPAPSSGLAARNCRNLRRLAALSASDGMANLPRTRWPALPNSFGWHGRGSRSILHIAEVHTQSPCPCREGASLMPSPAEKRATFHKLHAEGCFVIPNPWDVGSARYLQGLGFKALATTSGGYADAPEGVAESVKLCIETGVAGLSIEDSTSDPAIPLYDFELALARVRAARAAIDAAGGDVVFTARSEGFIRGRPDLEETIRRLKAFAAAGADCLYAPGIKTREQIAAVVTAVAPKPVNFLMFSAAANLS